MSNKKFQVNQSKLNSFLSILDIYSLSFQGKNHLHKLNIWINHHQNMFSNFLLHLHQLKHNKYYILNHLHLYNSHHHNLYLDLSMYLHLLTIFVNNNQLYKKHIGLILHYHKLNNPHNSLCIHYDLYLHTNKFNLDIHLNILPVLNHQNPYNTLDTYLK